jgi:signal transduction histidine kinase
LANVARHAHARSAAVELVRREDSLSLTIKDDGVGFVPQQSIGRPGHFGLLGLGERVRLAGGTMQVLSAPGQGTELRVELPLALEDKEKAP